MPENLLLPYMAKIGAGKTTSKHLTRNEAREAMAIILRQQFDPVTFGAFFMGLRYKGETPEEVAGFLDAIHAAQYAAETTRTAISSSSRMRAHIATPASASKPPLHSPDVPAGPLLSCAGAYDGKSRTFNVSLAASLIVAAAGVPIILHGTRGVPTKFGLTLSHLLHALGIPAAPPLSQVRQNLATLRIAYVDQAQLNPALHALLPFRAAMGKRTILNTLETLSLPLGARHHVGGFFHDAYAHLICEALQQPGLPVTRAIFVKGIEGSDELRPGGVFYAETPSRGDKPNTPAADPAAPSTSGLTAAAPPAPGSTLAAPPAPGTAPTPAAPSAHESAPPAPAANYQIVPINSDDLGLPFAITDLSARADTIEEQTRLSIQALNHLLQNPDHDTPYRNAVLLNAALRLYTAGQTPTLKEAVTLARETLQTNTPAQILNQWQSGQ